MSLPHAKSGAVLDVTPLGDQLNRTKTWTLVKTDAVQVIRLVVPAGKVIPEHRAPGELTVQCLEGEVDFTAHGKTATLTAGQLIYLDAAVPHGLVAQRDASLLVTILTARR